jgi:hypothetical protein
MHPIQRVKIAKRMIALEVGVNWNIDLGKPVLELPDSQISPGGGEEWEKKGKSCKSGIFTCHIIPKVQPRNEANNHPNVMWNQCCNTQSSHHQTLYSGGV